MRVTGILLAAGTASRFGGPKLLADVGRGEPMCVTAYRNLRAALDDVLVVVRPGDDAVQRALAAAGAALVPCAGASQGMGASLACGARAAARGACLVALADMPFIRPETVRRVAQALRDGASIAAPAFEGRRGHPVGFGAPLIGALQHCSGDAGARDVLQAHAAELRLLAVDDPGVLHDIDTKAQLPSGPASPAMRPPQP